MLLDLMCMGMLLWGCPERVVSKEARKARKNGHHRKRIKHWAKWAGQQLPLRLRNSLFHFAFACAPTEFENFAFLYANAPSRFYPCQIGVSQNGWEDRAELERSLEVDHFCNRTRREFFRPRSGYVRIRATFRKHGCSSGSCPLLSTRTYRSSIGQAGPATS